MQVRGATPGNFADLREVLEPKPHGPVIGFYGDRPISAAVVDRFGQRFSYAGLAPRRRDGCCDFNALQPGEWIVAPGLIYMWDAGNQRPRSHRLASCAALNLRSALSFLISRSAGRNSHVLMRHLKGG